MGGLKKAVAYLYKATKEQKGGYSSFGQLAVVNRYAEAHGIEILEMYRDDGKERFDLNTLLVIDAPTGEFDCVIVDRLTRFGRKSTQILSAVNALRDYGITVISVMEGIDTSSNTGAFVLAVLSALSDVGIGR